MHKTVPLLGLSTRSGAAGGRVESLLKIFLASLRWVQCCAQKL
ncbi:hypothetical protein GALL_264490 [mine drainage metagenome]|uniref:Uncharacterized protein n=1 Tax=mine drainage metagenome TaxID=410659 RepID=A0A1J5R8J3_9ZZZZ